MERAGLASMLGWEPGLGRQERNEVCIPSDSAQLRVAMARAAAGRGSLFIGDTTATEAARRAMEALAVLAPAGDPGLGWLCLATGGSGGVLKCARHDQDTILAAVAGFREHFQIDCVNSIGLLPLHHVSGFMAWARSSLSGGRYLAWDWKRLESGEFPELDSPGDWVLSLVPTQLARLISEPAALAWLRSLKVIFLGGGPAWPRLLEDARTACLPLAPGYGMTETAAMVTALRPAEFLAGVEGAGSALPHASVAITADGRISIEATSLHRGYHPEWRPPGAMITNDLGELSPEGRLRVLGRSDAAIISGGKKISPEEVEAALLGTGLLDDVIVAGLTHAEWGQEVVAYVPRPIVQATEDALRQKLKGQLPGWKLPKRFLQLSPWPRTAQGKVRRASLT